MNTGGDAAERLVRDSLMITEEAVKLAGLGAKNLAAILVALAKEEEKTHGPTRLTRLLRSGEELKLLPIKSEDLRQFRRLAKEYGVLFCPIKNKSLDNGLNDILFPASAAVRRSIWADSSARFIPLDESPLFRYSAARRCVMRSISVFVCALYAQSAALSVILCSSRNLCCARYRSKRYSSPRSA